MRKTKIPVDTISPDLSTWDLNLLNPNLSQIMRSHSSRYFAFITLFISCFNIADLTAQDANSAETSIQSDSETPAAKDKTLTFSINPLQLESQNNADEVSWVDVGESKLLVLNYLAEGAKYQGDILFFAAQGEHPGHLRLVDPLTKQLRALGWKIIVPLLPSEDFPKLSSHKTSQEPIEQQVENNPISDTSEPNSSENQNSAPTLAEPSAVDVEITHHFFENETAYQVFFETGLQNLMASINSDSKNIILAVNQTSAYWALNVDISALGFSHLVILTPQIPAIENPDLSAKFSNQVIPTFAFLPKNRTSNEFSQAFRRKLWTSPILRIDDSDYFGQKVQTEDTQLSRKIDGWVRSTNQNN